MPKCTATNLRSISACVIEADLKAGYVTPVGARRDYGYE